MLGVDIDNHPYPQPGPSRLPFDNASAYAQQQQQTLMQITHSPHPGGFSFSIGSGSFKQQFNFYPGCSPGTLMGPLDYPDLKHTLSPPNTNTVGSFGFGGDLGPMMSTSMTSTSLRKMLGSMPKGDGTICRDYTCCNIQLTDLHALVEHFEEHHVIVMDEPHAFMPPVPSATVAPVVTTTAAPTAINPVAPPVPAPIPPQAQQVQVTAPIQQQQQQPISAPSPEVDIDTMDDMDIEMDEHEHEYSSPSGSGSISGASTPSPPLTPVLPFDTTAVRRPSAISGVGVGVGVGSSRPTSPRLDLDRAFNRYAGYTEFSSMLPGTLAKGDGVNVSPAATAAAATAASIMTISKQPGMKGKVPFQQQFLNAHKAANVASGGNGVLGAGGIPPSLLSSATQTPNSTPPPSPSLTNVRAHTHPHSSDSTSSYSRSSTPGTSTGSQPSALLLSKPFQCPKPGCNKSYKQANGLKYHIQHGSCNFAPRDESLDQLSEKELEEKLKPFRCGVGPCERRYKNMNGLRYHYQHSGAHGAIGLALLASGQHDGLGPSPASTFGQNYSQPSSTASSRMHTPQPQSQPHHYKQMDVIMT